MICEFGNVQICKWGMLKFFRKYELQWKAVAVIVWMFAAARRIFFISESEENKNFKLFIGIIWALLGIFYLIDLIDLIRLKKRNRITESTSE